MHYQLQKQLDRAQHSQQALIQVRVLNTQGSSYRKSGARMLINEDGQQFDLISGGCIETHLTRHAKQVMIDGKPKSIDYDFSDPDAPEWLISVGCRGKVTLLIEKLSPANDYGSLALYLQARQERHTSWLVTDMLTGHTKRLPEAPKASAEIIIEAVKPAPRLLLVGTGPDTDAIIDLARKLDYLVQVIGCQSQSLQAFHHRYPHLSEPIEAPYLDAYLAANPVDYALIMTHNQALDAAYLSQKSFAKLPLVGLLGPAERKQRVINQMTGPVPLNLLGPIGLDLGGHGAQAVALSIMAQIQALEFQTSATPLANKKTGVHD